MASKLRMAIFLALAGAGITIGLISAQERRPIVLDRAPVPMVQDPYPTFNGIAMVVLCRKCRQQVFRLSCRPSAFLHIRKPEDTSLIFTSKGNVNGPGFGPARCKLLFLNNDAQKRLLI